MLFPGEGPREARAHVKYLPSFDRELNSFFSALMLRVMTQRDAP